jgi:dGTPase
VADRAAPARGYGPEDAARRLPEQHHNARGDFVRDRGRVIHSSALRRLSQKTQVLSPTAGLDFARNRLTHSLEVAQIGREIAIDLGLDPDVVDTACLAHDLGHPPFGHNGERALNSWAASIGGFEGNAQTLRLLTRLEPKVFDAEGRAFGLNLTRASLDASCKYPWPQEEGEQDPSGRSKFGFYADDAETFRWLRAGAPERRRCIEAQVMDLADDIAYSVHDFEDAIVNGFIDVPALSARVDHEDLVASMVAWIGEEVPQDELIAAFDRLDSLGSWLETWDGGRRDLARLKNLTSQLIGRFAGRASEATRAAHSAGPGPSGSLARFGAGVEVPSDTRAEISVLKGIVAANVMSTNARRPIYSRQRGILTELADHLWASGDAHLDPGFRADWAQAPDDIARRRVVVDQVASLTDVSAVAWHERLVG